LRVTETESEWAKRLAAHLRWRAMLAKHGAGMRFIDDDDSACRIVGRDEIDVRDYGGRLENDCYTLDDPTSHEVTYPDLVDPATLGCLDAILYEAGEGIVAVISDPVEMHRWHIMCAEFRGQHCQWQHHGAGTFATKGEALARAILAAWGAA
jgi:hypothetical protein